MKKRTQTFRMLQHLLLASVLLLSFPFLGACSNQSENSEEAIAFINRANTYADQGQYRSAMLEARNAIQAEPANVSHVVRLAELFQEVGAHGRASELLEPWLDDHADFVALPLAKSYVEQGKQLSAMETLENYSAASSQEQLEVALIRAEALRLSGEKAEALALFRNLIESNPSSAEATIGAARSYIDLNKLQQASETLGSWLSANGLEPRVLYWKGVTQYLTNQLEEAAATLTDAVAEIPTSDVFLPIRRNILTALSKVLTEQGKIAEAQVYNQVLAQNTNTAAEEQGKAAMAAIKEGNIEEAKNILRDMLKLYPENEQVAMMLGALSAGTGDLEEGSRLLTENLDPETTPTQFIRAATLAKIDAGEREEALKILARAIKARPNDNELLAMHGILALGLPAHEQEGVTSLSKAISNEPERVRFRFALAQYHVRKNQPEQALGQLRMAFATNPAEWSTTGAYLSLLIRENENEEAAEIRDSLLNGYGNEPSAVMLASMVDVKLGNIDEAKHRLEKLAEESPKLQAAKVSLAMLYAQSGQTEQAVNTMVDAAKITPDTITPLQRAGQIYARNHTVAEIEQWLNKIGKEHPELKKNADTLVALIKIGQGNLNEARLLLEEWQNSDSDAVSRATGQLLRAEAQSEAKSGDYKTARAKAAEAITLEPENLGYALLPVGIYQAEGKLDEALSALVAVEEKFGKQRAVLLARANLLEQNNGKRAAYDYLLNQWKNSRDTGLMPALIRLAKTEAPQAQDELTLEWLESDPDSAAAHMMRADFLMLNQRGTVAAHHYEEVISKQPNNIAALNNLAWLLKDSSLERALELAGLARNLAPENPAVLDTYGWIQHLSGNHSEAESALEKAVALAPDNAEIRVHREAIRKEM